MNEKQMEGLGARAGAERESQIGDLRLQKGGDRPGAEGASQIGDLRAQTEKKATGIGALGGYRRNGNVARLPKVVRDRVNLMILDGVPYGEIIEQLGEHGEGLDISNLSRWKDGGHQDWLVEQAFLEVTRARRETPGELVRDFDATEVNHAALQLGTLHIFDALRELEPGSLNKRLGGDCAAFARLINALARASRETMLLQKYREVCAQARLVLDKLKDPNRELNESETRAIVRQVDQILGLAAASQDKGAWSLQRRPGNSAPTLETGPPCPLPAERVCENSNETPREGTRPTGNSRAPA